MNSWAIKSRERWREGERGRAGGKGRERERVSKMLLFRVIFTLKCQDFLVALQFCLLSSILRNITHTHSNQRYSHGIKHISMLNRFVRFNFFLIIILECFVFYSKCVRRLTQIETHSMFRAHNFYGLENGITNIFERNASFV